MVKNRGSGITGLYCGEAVSEDSCGPNEVTCVKRLALAAVLWVWWWGSFGSLHVVL